MIQPFIASWEKRQGKGAGLVQSGKEEAKGEPNSHLPLHEGQ